MMVCCLSSWDGKEADSAGNINEYVRFLYRIPPELDQTSTILQNAHDKYQDMVIDILTYDPLIHLQLIDISFRYLQNADTSN